MVEYDFGQAYLKLALELDKHNEGYVDAYYGPGEIKKEVESGDLRTPEQLKDDHQRLLDKIPMEDPQRQKYLAAQLDAMGFLIQKLNGEEFYYMEEVEGLFGIKPELVPEEVFLETHRVLDRYVPGKGSLANRIDQRSKELKVPADKIPQAADLILDKIHVDTGNLLSLIPGESFKTSYVHDRPWIAYHYYQGDYQSKIEINLDIDWAIDLLVYVLCHEAYPGHHTEFQNKEHALYQKKGYLEESCNILLTPRSIVTEGIAVAGLETLYPELEIFRWVAEELMPALQLPEASAQELTNYHLARIRLMKVRGNSAIHYHKGGFSKEEVLDYLQTYQLIDGKKAEQLSRFIFDPFWKTFIFTYTEGYRLIDQATHGKNKVSLFKRLITEQLLPEDII